MSNKKFQVEVWNDDTQRWEARGPVCNDHNDAENLEPEYWDQGFMTRISEVRLRHRPGGAVSATILGFTPDTLEVHVANHAAALEAPELAVYRLPKRDENGRTIWRYCKTREEVQRLVGSDSRQRYMGPKRSKWYAAVALWNPTLHKECPFPTAPRNEQVWCDECHKWTSRGVL